MTDAASLSLRDFVQHKPECALSSHYWNKAANDIPDCTCGLADVLARSESSLREQIEKLPRYHQYCLPIPNDNLRINLIKLADVLARLPVEGEKGNFDMIRVIPGTWRCAKCEWKSNASPTEDDEIHAHIESHYPQPIFASRPAETRWHPIDARTPREDRVFFWVVPKTADESYTNTSGEPITSNHKGYRHEGKWGTWGALSKPTHWMPLPAPPRDADTRQQTKDDHAVLPDSRVDPTTL